MRKLYDYGRESFCYCEQKISYNFLFSHCHINELPLQTILKFVDTTKGIEKYDIQTIKRCITKNYEQYKQKPFIASHYGEINERLPI